jgi:rhodanese-related sulfurtransferase
MSQKNTLDDFLKEIDNNNYTLIDVRTVTEFEKGTIPNAINFPLDDIRNNIDSIKKLNRPIIIFCQRGLRGYLAELILNQNGIENVVNVAGGFKLWQMFSDKIVIPEPVLVELK